MKYKGIVFDIDGTITSHVSSWQYIHERLGRWDGVAAAYQEKFLAGEISYRRFCELDAAEWKGMEDRKLREFFTDIPYAPNAPECLRRLKKLGFRLAAVSTGLQYIPKIIKEEFDFDCILYNRLLSKKGRLTGEVRIEVSHEGKGLALENILRRMKISSEEMIGVGDSGGDIALAEKCGYFIAFNSSSRKLSEKADHECVSGDFREVAGIILAASGLADTEYSGGAQ